MHKTITKPVAGADFLESPKVTKKIRDLLYEERSILISGPPNSGKTTFLVFLRENLAHYFNPVYVNVEAINKIDDYCQKIQYVLYSDMGEFFSTDAIFGVNEVRDRQQISNYFYEQLFQTLCCYNSDSPVVIMIDNFSWMLENLYSKEGLDGVVYLLNLEQKLRKDIEANNLMVQFIYTSSIDLDKIVAEFNVGQSLSDLCSFHIPPFSEEEAVHLIEKFIKTMKFNIYPPQIRYLCQKIPLLYPINIKLAFEELDYLYLNNDFRVITDSIIDEAIETLLIHKDYMKPEPGYLEAI